MTYLDTVNSIVERLRQAMPLGVDIQMFPESDEYERGLERPRVNVLYVSSEFEASKATDITAQPEIMNILVLVQARQQELQQRGALAIVGTVKKFLLGFKPTNGGKMVLKSLQMAPPDSEGFKGVWVYELTFTTATIAVEHQDDDLTPLITEITHVAAVEDYAGDLTEINILVTPAAE